MAKRGNLAALEEERRQAPYCSFPFLSFSGIKGEALAGLYPLCMTLQFECCEHMVNTCPVVHFVTSDCERDPRLIMV
jgi:hypothetical protein